MRITRVQAYPLNLTVSPEFVITTTLGTHDISQYVLIAIESSDGTVGWGEATVVAKWSGESQPGSLHLVNDVFKPLLIGRDAFDTESIMKSINTTVVDNTFTKSAIEMAL